MRNAMLNKTMYPVELGQRRVPVGTQVSIIESKMGLAKVMLKGEVFIVPHSTLRYMEVNR